MNEKELKEFIANRKPSNNIELDVNKLVCYGCAHSVAEHPYPSFPSGERPCCSCIRNPDREIWQENHPIEDVIRIDEMGHARIMNPYSGNAYNGAPYIHF